jgi:hypothetical protein
MVGRFPRASAANCRKMRNPIRYLPVKKYYRRKVLQKLDVSLTCTCSGCRYRSQRPTRVKHVHCAVDRPDYR